MAAKKQAPARRKPSAPSNEKTCRKPGRPSTLSPTVAEQICTRLALGDSLVSICRSRGMPHYETVRRWLAKGDLDGAPEEYREFRVRYARAREDQADALADEMLDVARSAGEKDAQAKRLLVDTLKWRASKLKPKVYGDKFAHEHGGRLDAPPIPVMNFDVDIKKYSPEEAIRIYQRIIAADG